MVQFQDMSLAEPIKKALVKLEFKEPTKVQNAVIEQSLEGKDIMACAETGSGKTGAFGIPLVQRLLEEKNRNALILAPTRELAKQIAGVMMELTRYCDNIRVTTLVGGTDMMRQFRALKNKPRILVATPGRLNDHLRRRSIKLDKTKILVLDEGDRMLDMGFQPQLDEILEYLPKNRQTSLFTATLPIKVKNLAKVYLQDPVKMDVGRVSLPVEKIKQSILQVNNKEKNDKLVDELNKRKGSIIVFFRTKFRTDEVADYLQEFGFKVGIIHGDLSQGKRNRSIQNFRTEKTRVLCATDVASRGIDVPLVGHVINYDLPIIEEDYIHRIGRTARNGAEGEALSFVARQDHSAWIRLAKRYKIQGVELKNILTSSSGGEERRFKSRSQGGGRNNSLKKYRRTKASTAVGRREWDHKSSRRDDNGLPDRRKKRGSSAGPSMRWAKSKHSEFSETGLKRNYSKRSKSNTNSSDEKRSSFSRTQTGFKKKSCFKKAFENGGRGFKQYGGAKREAGNLKHLTNSKKSF